MTVQELIWELEKIENPHLQVLTSQCYQGDYYYEGIERVAVIYKREWHIHPGDKTEFPVVVIE